VRSQGVQISGRRLHESSPFGKQGLKMHYESNVCATLNIARYKTQYIEQTLLIMVSQDICLHSVCSDHVGQESSILTRDCFKHTVHLGNQCSRASGLPKAPARGHDRWYPSKDQQKLVLSLKREKEALIKRSCNSHIPVLQKSLIPNKNSAPGNLRKAGSTADFVRGWCRVFAS
jgi:hypothetical protein